MPRSRSSSLPGGEPGLDEAAEGFDRAAGGDTFGAAAGPEAEVEVAFWAGCFDAAAAVAVQPQSGCGASLSDLGDETPMPGSVENADAEFGNRLAQRVGERRDGLGDRVADVDESCGVGSGYEPSQPEGRQPRA